MTRRNRNRPTYQSSADENDRRRRKLIREGERFAARLGIRFEASEVGLSQRKSNNFVAGQLSDMGLRACFFPYGSRPHFLITHAEPGGGVNFERIPVEVRKICTTKDVEHLRGLLTA